MFHLNATRKNVRFFPFSYMNVIFFDGESFSLINEMAYSCSSFVSHNTSKTQRFCSYWLFFFFWSLLACCYRPISFPMQSTRQEIASSL
uniref:Ovule protein n=1 Tax=Ascaris lumbricoides TaxID=6252 RepID=A0A0M3I4G7_ASCLU